METKEKNCCRQTKRDEQDKRQIIIRLNKIIGQMNGDQSICWIDYL